MDVPTAQALHNTVTNIAYGTGGSAVLLGLAVGILAMKVKSVGVLWGKWDSFQKEYSADRLQDAKEYATQKQVERATTRLEGKIDTLNEKIDKLLQRDGL